MQSFFNLDTSGILDRIILSHGKSALGVVYSISGLQLTDASSTCAHHPLPRPVVKKKKNPDISKCPLGWGTLSGVSLLPPPKDDKIQVPKSMKFTQNYSANGKLLALGATTSQYSH